MSNLDTTPLARTAARLEAEGDTDTAFVLRNYAAMNFQPADVVDIMVERDELTVADMIEAEMRPAHLR